MTKSRIFLFLLLSFIAGIAVRSFLYVPHFLIWVILLAALAVSSAGILRKEKALVVYGFLVVAFLVGILRFDQIEQSRPDLSDLYGKSHEMEGIVAEEPERTEKVERLTFKVSVVDSRVVESFLSLVTLRKYPEYSLGDELQIQGVLERPENFAGFDYISHLSRRDIYSTVSFPEVKKIAEGQGNWLRIVLPKIKNLFEEKIDRVLAEPHAAFLKGLLLGERESLPAELIEDFKKTGTTHIVALSGYNITMVGRFFTALLLLFTVPFQISFWVASSGIILFVLLTGASSSVVRAGIMGILVLLAEREGRVYSMTNAIAFAAAGMIFHNPKILRFDAAFQLSFLATLGLVYLSPLVGQKIERLILRLRSRFRGENEFDSRFGMPGAKKSSIFPLKQTLIETLSAQLMVLPLLIYLFGRVSLISPIANMLILMAVPYSMAIGFTAGVAGFLWRPLSQLLGFATWVLLEYQIRVIEFFAKIPLASVNLGIAFALPLSVLYAFFLWRLWHGRDRH